uniref:Uncharacterized protein n=1 Tax=Clastoptera arizonana TaxID=38151 RepID=A0A1B6DGF3_9HEMI
MSYVLNYGFAAQNNSPQIAIIFDSLNFQNNPSLTFSLNWNFFSLGDCPVQILSSLIWSIPSQNIIPTAVITINLILPSPRSMFQFVLSFNWYFPWNENLPEIIYSINFSLPSPETTPSITFCKKWRYDGRYLGTQIIALL